MEVEPAMVGIEEDAPERIVRGQGARGRQDAAKALGSARTIGGACTRWRVGSNWTRSAS